MEAYDFKSGEFTFKFKKGETGELFAEVAHSGKPFVGLSHQSLADLADGCEMCLDYVEEKVKDNE